MTTSQISSLLRFTRKSSVGLILGAATVGTVACGSAPPPTVLIDGSSTVFPIAQALAEELRGERPEYRVTVGISGTGGGFKRFCSGEIDVSNASRRITRAEAQRCADSGVVPVAFPVALDGITVVTNLKNDFASCLSLAELRQIWEPASRVTSWRQVRPHFPDEEIGLYGPGTDSGTFDFFTRVVVGRPKASRPDYYPSEDDYFVVRAVSGDPWGLGYFGLSYYTTNQDGLRAVQIDTGYGCVAPSPKSIAEGSYGPLTRELFVYVRRGAIRRPEVRAFLESTIETGSRVAEEVGYVALHPSEYRRNRVLLDQVVADLGLS